MTPPAATTTRAPSGGLATLRRLILYVLLFALVIIAASGVGGLLNRLFHTASVLVTGDPASLALPLAFTLIGGPLALLLWWFAWRRLSDSAERTAVGWSLYLSGCTPSRSRSPPPRCSIWQRLSSIRGQTGGSPHSPTAWCGRSSGSGTGGCGSTRQTMTHLEDARTLLGSVFGLLLGAGAAIAALSGLLDVAIRGFPLSAAVEPWWYAPVRSLVWASGGALVWWWHWFREGGRHVRTTLADVAVTAAGIFVAGIGALGGVGVVVFVLLRLAFDRSDPVNLLLEPLAPAISAAAIGAVWMWRYHPECGGNPFRRNQARQPPGHLGRCACRGGFRRGRGGERLAGRRRLTFGRRRRAHPAAGRYQLPRGGRPGVVAGVKPRGRPGRRAKSHPAGAFTWWRHSSASAPWWP